MIKYSSINMNTNLISKNVEKVPAITEKELRQKFVDCYLKYETKFSQCYKLYLLEGESKTDISIADKHADFLISLPGNNILKDVGLNKIYNDFEMEFPLKRFHTLDNGFTFYGYAGQGDETGTYFFIVYWDGKKFRGYVPKYGNTYLVDMESFEGLYDYSSDEDAPYKKWYKSPKVQALTKDERIAINKYLEEDGEGYNHVDDGVDEWVDEGLELPLTRVIPFNVFSKLPKRIAYRIAHGYNPCTQDDYNWDAIEIDLKAKFKVI